MLAVSKKISAAERIKNLFVNTNFCIATCNDFFGAEFAFCLKNIMALASGLFYGLHHSDSSKGSFIAAA